MAAPQPPTRSRGFSVTSDHSSPEISKGHQRGSSGSSGKTSHSRLGTKADPLLAMTEEEPNNVALQKSNLGSLRDIEHKDQYGNIITDPDLSNPTRPRFERPLDTIRSFEAAINGRYGNNRRSYAPTEDARSQMGDWSRGTSYYGAQHGRDNRNTHYTHYSGYQQSPQSPGSFSYNQYPPQNGRDRTYNPHRSHSSPRVSPNGNDSPYSNSGTDPYGQSTNPSSIDSFHDQMQQHAPQPRPDDRSPEYGFNGFPSNGYGTSNVPPSGVPPAPKAVPAPAKSSPVMPSPVTANPQEKRKSWFKRRFSKD